MLAVVISDTHIPRRAKALPAGLLAHLGRADVILHAGDVMDAAVLEQLAAYAPAHAVGGNVDPPELELPQTLELDLGGVQVAMIHDSGRTEGRRRRLARHFPQARVVIFGHSHAPFAEDENGLLLLNPGSPTDRRRQPRHSFALLRVQAGEPSVELVYI